MGHQNIHYIPLLGTKQPISADAITLHHCISLSAATVPPETCMDMENNLEQQRTGALLWE